MGNCCCLNAETVPDDCAKLCGTWRSGNITLTVHANGHIDLYGWGTTISNWPCRGWAKLDDTVEFESLSLCICCCAFGKSEFKCIFQGDTVELHYNHNVAKDMAKS